MMTTATEATDTKPYLVARDTSVEMVNVVVLNPCGEELETLGQRYVGAAAHGIHIAAVVGLARLVTSFKGVLQVEKKLTCPTNTCSHRITM